MEVARIMNVKNVTATATRRVIFLPYFWRTNPAIRAAKIAPNGGVLAEIKTRTVRDWFHDG